jgi:hypothetical protein
MIQEHHGHPGYDPAKVVAIHDNVATAMIGVVGYKWQ